MLTNQKKEIVYDKTEVKVFIVSILKAKNFESIRKQLRKIWVILVKGKQI
jgi:hypothetical protein